MYLLAKVAIKPAHKKVPIIVSKIAISWYAGGILYY
jgi:hypothetical protein